MIEQTRSEPGPLPLRAAARLAGALGIVVLIGLAVAASYLLGRRIEAEQWPILVSATGLAVYIAVALHNPRHALLLWVATAPFARFVYLNLEFGRGIPDLTLNRLMSGVLVALLLAQLAIGRRRLARVTLLDLCVVAFVGMLALSVSSALVGVKSAAQAYFDLLVVPTVLYFLGRNLITSRRQFRHVLVMLVVVALYLALLAIREQITGDVWFYPEDRSITYTASIRRVVALLGNPAYIAVSIAMVVPWAWYLYLNARRGRLWLLLVIAILCAGVFMCMNRSGWAGLAISLFIMALFVKRFRGIFLLILLGAAVAAAVYWVVIVSSATVLERLTAQGPIEYRRETWQVAWNMIRDHPLFGLGWDNFRQLYMRYARWDIYLRATPTPHNTYLWVVLTGGLVALAPFLLMLVTTAFSALSLYYRALPRRALAPYADLAGTFLASMAAIWAPALVMDVLTSYYNTMLTFFIMGAFFGVAGWERWGWRLKTGALPGPEPASGVAQMATEVGR
ncbi:MAG: O-antigen ligase family protein [Chloroflexota bacterium]